MKKATLVIKNIDSLITVAGADAPRTGEEQGRAGIIKNDIVAVAGERIIYVGAGELPSDIIVDSSTVVIDGTGKTVTPGLVDSHTHLVHGGSRENELAMKLQGKSYLEILAAGGGIHSTARNTQAYSFDELYAQSLKSLNIMLSYGITTVEAKSGYGIGAFETELKQIAVAEALNKNHPVDVVSTFMGAHAVPEEYKGNSDAFVDILVNEMIPYIAEHKLAKFCDVFCEHGVFSVPQTERILEAAKKHGLLPKMHADEIVSLGGGELAAKVGCISAEHLLAVSEQGIADMAKNGVIAVLLPGTSFNLQKGSVAPARKMIEAGIPVAISTDYNPGSCPTENLQLVMTLATLTLKMLPEEVIVGTTINAAAALGLEKEIGSLVVGKKADLTIFDAKNLDYIIYHFGINHVDQVIKNGQIVFKNKKEV